MAEFQNNDNFGIAAKRSYRVPETVNITFGEAVYRQRNLLGVTQAEAALRGGVSTGYFSEIENGKRLPPPRHTALRIAYALGMDQTRAQEFACLALRERGGDRSDKDLPPDILDLINEIRCNAYSLRPRFIRGLRARIVEAIM